MTRRNYLEAVLIQLKSLTNYWSKVHQRIFAAQTIAMAMKKAMAELTT